MDIGYNQIRFFGSFSNGLKQKGSLWLKAKLCSKLIFPFFPNFGPFLTIFQSGPHRKCCETLKKSAKIAQNWENLTS